MTKLFYIQSAHRALLVALLSTTISFTAAQASSGGLDTPAGVSSLPLAVSGSVGLILNGNPGDPTQPPTVSFNGPIVEGASTINKDGSMIVGSNIGVSPALSVNGDARIGNTGAACTGANAGTLRWTGIEFEGCDGANWAPFTSTPPGAVMAFNLTACPSGWAPFAPVAGRAIIGAGSGPGLTNRNFGDAGGEEQHQLTIAELPSHSFTLPLQYANLSKGWNPGVGAPGAEASTLGSGGAVTSYSLGSDVPHNVMMPWIALLYCQKL